MESFATISTSHGEIELTPANTSLYRHIAQYALFDHFFIQEDNVGFYIWSHEEAFPLLDEASADEPIPRHLNIQKVAQVDEDNYITEFTQDLRESDSFPESWDA